jgi:predicted transcriptional regulator
MSIENVAVSTVMVKDVKTANENNSLLEICRIMNINKIGSVIIIADFNKLHKKHLLES